MAASAEQMFTFFADVKQELEVILVVLGLPKNVSCLLPSISVDNNTIEVTWNRGEDDVQRLCKFNVTGISMLPSTYSRLHMSADGSLNLRLKVKSEATNILCSPDPQCNTASKNPNSWTNQARDVVGILSGESYVVLCRMCAASIVCNKKFQRVLPCPSDDWFEMSESWWCHGHDHDHNHDHDDGNPDESGLLCDSSLLSVNSVLETNGNQSQDEKYTSIAYDQSYNQLDQTDTSATNDRDDAQSEADQEETNITINLPNSQTKDLTCSRLVRYDHFLNNSSENQPCLAGLHLDQTRDSDHGDSCKQTLIDQNRLLMGVADCLVSDVNVLFDENSLVPRSCLTTDKTRVQCARCRCYLGRFKNSDSLTQSSGFLDDGNNRLELMLHMLVVTSDPSKVTWPYSSEKFELELAAYLQTERETSNSFRFIIETRSETNAVVPIIALWIVDVRTLLYSASSAASIEQECNVLPIPVIKLMYKDCLREQNKGTGQMWYRDLTVQSIELPESTCLSILKILIDSTKSLPQSLRVVGDFYVGFLRR